MAIGMGMVFLALTLLHVISVQREARGNKIVRLSETYDGVVEYLSRDIDDCGEKIPHKAMKTLGALKTDSYESDSWVIARIVLAFVLVQLVSHFLRKE
jgi:hypothetical protein